MIAPSGRSSISRRSCRLYFCARYLVGTSWKRRLLIPFILAGKKRSIPSMSLRRNKSFLILVILGARPCRRRRHYGTARLALKALAHRLSPGTHVTGGLHLASEHLFVTVFFQREQFQSACLEGLVQATDYPGDRMGHIVAFHDTQHLTVSQFFAISIDQADHISKLHQTNVISEINEFLEPRLAK